MEIIGQLYNIGEITENNGFKSRLFVIYVANDRNPNYPDYLQMELRNDKVTVLDSFTVGAQVKVHFDIRGRKYQKKDGSGEGFFNSLSAWSVSDVNAQPQQFASGAPQQYAGAKPAFGPEAVDIKPKTPAQPVIDNQLPF